MPIYEFECPKCHTKIEILVNSSKADLRCPICCEQDCNVEMKRIFSLTNFSFKGTGWAKDGYSSKKERSDD